MTVPDLTPEEKTAAAEARRSIQAVLDDHLPIDTAAQSAAIVLILLDAGWRPQSNGGDQ
jgi:hypothetical protein